MQLWTKIRDMLSPLKESLTLKRPVHCRFEIRVRAVRDKNQFYDYSNRIDRAG